MKAKELKGLTGLKVQFMRREYEYNMDTFHYHNSYEIYILEEGARKLFVGDKVYKTVENDAALFAPNVFHYSKGEGAHGGTCISFTEEYLDEYFTEAAKEKLTACFAREIITLTDKEVSMIKELLNGVGEEGDMGFACLAQVLKIMCSAKSSGENKNMLNTEKGIPPIITYINENFPTITGLDEIAEKFFMSKCYLCRKFKTDTGMTVTHYLNHVRIQRSCELLAQTDKSIAQISADCGYDSQAYYSRVFKNTMGCAPMEFRTKMKGQFRAFENIKTDKQQA